MIKMVIGIADCINDESINLWKHQQCKQTKHNIVIIIETKIVIIFGN